MRQGSGMGLRLRCDWGNPFACALLAIDSPARRALSESLTGLTVSHYSWSLTEHQFQVQMLILMLGRHSLSMLWTLCAHFVLSASALACYCNQLSLRCHTGAPGDGILLFWGREALQCLAEPLDIENGATTWVIDSICAATAQELCCLTNLRQLGVETRLPSKELKRSTSETLADGAVPEPLPPLGLASIPSDICRLSKVPKYYSRLLCIVLPCAGVQDCSWSDEPYAQHLYYPQPNLCRCSPACCICARCLKLSAHRKSCCP